MVWNINLTIVSAVSGPLLGSVQFSLACLIVTFRYTLQNEIQDVYLEPANVILRNEMRKKRKKSKQNWPVQREHFPTF